MSMRDDDDLVTAAEAAEIISQNSGKPVYIDYVNTLRHRGVLKAMKKPGYNRMNFYRYGDIKNIKVAEGSPGRPRQSDEAVKKRSLDMREYRIRRKAEQAAQIGTTGKSETSD
jgi:hypothetical protein